MIEKTYFTNYIHIEINIVNLDYENFVVINLRNLCFFFLQIF